MIADLLQALPLPALTVGSDERIGSINAAASSLLGAGAAGRHYITIIRQPALLDAVDGALKTGETYTARFLSTEASRDRTWDVFVAAFGTGGDVLVTFQDQSHLEDAGVQRRDFVANVSHELRTPLTALLGFIETMQGAARNDPDAQARFLSIMQREATRMNRLVNDLLSLNRVESQERIRPIERADLAKQTSAVVSALEHMARENGIIIGTEGLSEPADVFGDADQLSQIATNLLENAIKYSGNGSKVLVSVSDVSAHPMLRGPAKVLTVEDSGEGIDAIHIPRLTERFYRIDAHRSREQGGTGLGLAIVKHIVNRHRGRLKITSERGKGSRFQIVLPAFSSEEVTP